MSISAHGALASAVLLIASSACGDITSVSGELETVADSGTVYAINGTPASLPSAIYLYAGSLMRVDADFTFDLAFDLADNGEIIFIPVRALASEYISTRTVSLAPAASAFELVTEMPWGQTFRADTAMTIPVGQTVLVRVDESVRACSSSSVSGVIYAKVVVRSVDLVQRSMRVEYVVDPNCGYRSFASGYPTY